jgi:hypothetical protein
MNIKSGGLHEKHVVSSNLGTISAFIWRQRKTTRTCVDMASRRTSRMHTLTSRQQSGRRKGVEAPRGFPIIIIIISGVRLSPLGTAATTDLLYQPQMIHDGDCGAVGGIKIGRGNRSFRRKPDRAPLCPPQIPDDQTREASLRSATTRHCLPGLIMKCMRSE